MGYVEKVLGTNEQVMYRTHQHPIVLLLRIVGWLLMFAVLLGLGLTVVTQHLDEPGNNARHTVGIILLCALVIPLFFMIRAWVRGDRGGGYLRAIWKSLLGAIALLALGLILMIHPTWWKTGWVGVILSAFPLAVITRMFLEWLNQRYMITNRRVVEINGIINKHMKDSALEKVNDLALRQSFVGRILKFGTVEIITGSDIGLNEFKGISNPVRFKRMMLDAKEQLGMGLPGVATAEGVSPAAPTAEALTAWASALNKADIPDMIKDLDDLRQKGIVTEEEFQAKKKELLDRL